MRGVAVGLLILGGAEAWQGAGGSWCWRRQAGSRLSVFGNRCLKPQGVIMAGDRNRQLSTKFAWDQGGDPLMDVLTPTGGGGGKVHTKRISKHKLDVFDLKDYAGSSLFDLFARLVCELDGVVPRKEVHESWESASIIHAAFPHSVQVVDLAGGNTLLSWALLILDDSGRRNVLCVDKFKSSAACRITDKFLQRWPNLGSRFRHVEGDLADLRPRRDSLLVAVHACGALTDTIMELGAAARAQMVLVPCCHSLQDSSSTMTFLQHPRGEEALPFVRRMSKRVGMGAAIDSARVRCLRRMGYIVRCCKISDSITPQNRVILAHMRQEEAEETDASRSTLPPLWPFQKLPRNAWSWYAGDAGSKQKLERKNSGLPEREAVTKGAPQLLHWGSNHRRQSFKEVFMMHETTRRQTLFCFCYQNILPSSLSMVYKSLGSLGVKVG
uniref:Methyltransferase domain-containing protein n=1 Tax=Guillardia theta TaxID=55529 RepID=A0A7S4NNV8_GUITH|mmetsp:Transcript_2651/g.8874  ORF Transcript_2651/g.8874 Transcript_2651/m.8874 type:complete len:440 (+) Transcript_2651:69-1388(+)